VSERGTRLPQVREDFTAGAICDALLDSLRHPDRAFPWRPFGLSPLQH
jgi:hypothetical protein